MEGENRDEENIEIHADRELEEGALVIDKNNVWLKESSPKITR